MLLVIHELWSRQLTFVFLTCVSGDDDGDQNSGEVEDDVQFFVSNDVHFTSAKMSRYLSGSRVILRKRKS